MLKNLVSATIYLYMEGEQKSISGKPFVESEMETALSRIWIRVADSIFYKHYILYIPFL